MMNLACSGELESASWGEDSLVGGGARVRVVGNGRQECLATERGTI